jgi:cardiolipin synthase
VEIHEYKPALLHAKTMVIDSMWSTVGSTNLDRRSFALNEELNLVIYDAGVAKRLEEVFEKDLSESTRVTYQRWANRGIVNRVLEWLAVPVRDQL